MGLDGKKLQNDMTRKQRVPKERNGKRGEEEENKDNIWKVNEVKR